MQILALAPVATTGWVTTRPCRSLKSAAPALAVPRARHLRVQAFQETPAPPAPAAAKPAAAAEKKEVDHVPLVLEELKAKKKVLIAQTAPAVRIAIGEELGLGPGVNATGKMVAALRRLGFDYVFDTLAGADLTIMEEGFELLERLEGLVSRRADLPPLPMFTSCCPGWIGFVETCAPEIIPHVSTCKSPHMMVGAVLKTYFAEKIQRRASDISVVSVMPCVRKQGEADRMMFHTPDGSARDVDHVITTKELAKMCQEQGIDFANLPDEEYDEFLGIGTGAAALFGTTGGVMEAALRTVYDVVTGERLDRLNWDPVRGLEGTKEASITIAPHPEGPLHNTEPVTVNIAVANGLGNAKKLLKAVQEGQKEYHFIEVMACPGGCIGGGGQPRSKDKEILQKRQGALYSVDERQVLRRSHENPVVQQLYDEFLERPNSHKAHELLHTYYVPCGPEKFDINAPPGEMASPVATCTLDLGLETVCDPVQHHEICQVDDGNPHSDSEPPAAPNALHAE